MTTITIDALTAITSKQFEMEVREGLTFILNHLDGLWPRMISTYATKGAQKEVKNFTEAMAWFKAANFLDCRISAYPRYTNDYINRTGIAPTVLLVDIDREHFRIAEEFESVVTRTYSNFYDVLGSRPTQLATGGGIHFLARQQVGVFEKSETFSKFDQPGRRFMQYEEQILTDGKGDQSHWNTVSFNNMLLRIPFSLNSKLVQLDDKGGIIDIPYDARIRIEKRWDEDIPIVGRTLLMQYYTYLQFSIIRDRQKQRQRTRDRLYGRAKECRQINTHDYDYIQKLINKPLDDFRKFCIWRVFVPYFVNIKGLSGSGTFDQVKSWLDRCNSISRLGFNIKQKIDYELDHVGKFTPIRVDQLKSEHNRLYTRLQREGLIN
jgi:hypothetical protein